jgi:hypothetical protein
MFGGVTPSSSCCIKENFWSVTHVESCKKKLEGQTYWSTEYGGVKISLGGRKGRPNNEMVRGCENFSTSKLIGTGTKI